MLAFRRMLLFCWVVVFTTRFVLATEPLDPRQPYTAAKRSPVTHSAELAVTITAPFKTKLLRVWVPVPQSDSAQTVMRSEFSTFPVTIEPQIAVEPVFGNKFAYFEFANPQGAMIVRHKLEVQVAELRWELDPSKVRSVTDWPESFTPYLRNESQAVVADVRFDKLLTEIVPQRRNPLLDLSKVMNYADQNFKYDHKRASLKASSLNALDQKAGHCSDYHGFCAAMGRLMKQPTRVTYGINTFPKASPSHCKLEAFLPPYGWVSFDVSETQKMTAAIRADGKLSEAEKSALVQKAHGRMILGFRDNTWFKQTQGTDYDLVPKASRKVPVVCTIYAEADGEPLPDPDPSDSSETKFAWMTSHKFESTPPVKYPFTDIESLKDQ